MIDQSTYKELLSIREMARLLYDNVDKTLKKVSPDISISGQIKKGGLKPEQIARIKLQRQKANASIAVNYKKKKNKGNV